MSKVVRFHKAGDADVLQIEEVDTRHPQKREVRIKVEAIGLNRAEVMFRSGQYLEQPEFPSRLGYEASGVVEEIGEEVESVKVGDRVSSIPAFSMGEYGVYGETAILPEHALANYPENLTPEEGTSIWMAFITAYGALVNIGKVKAGDHVVITAASSSVGLAAIHITKALDATVIAVTRKKDKVNFLSSNGADHVIATEADNIVETIQTITKNNGANVFFDPIAGSILTDLAQSAAYGATIIEYGALAAEPAAYPLFESLAKGITIRGYTLFEVTTNPERLAEAKKFVFEALKEGKIKPVIDRVFEFENIVEAHQYMESNQQKGKIVVSLNGK